MKHIKTITTLLLIVSMTLTLVACTNQTTSPTTQTTLSKSKADAHTYDFDKLYAMSNADLLNLFITNGMILHPTTQNMDKERLAQLFRDEFPLLCKGLSSQKGVAMFQLARQTKQTYEKLCQNEANAKVYSFLELTTLKADELMNYFLANDLGFDEMLLEHSSLKAIAEDFHANFPLYSLGVDVPDSRPGTTSLSHDTKKVLDNLGLKRTAIAKTYAQAELEAMSGQELQTLFTASGFLPMSPFNDFTPAKQADFFSEVVTSKGQAGLGISAINTANLYQQANVIYELLLQR